MSYAQINVRDEVEHALKEALDPFEAELLSETFDLDINIESESSSLLSRKLPSNVFSEKLKDKRFSEALRKLRC